MFQEKKYKCECFTSDQKQDESCSLPVHQCFRYENDSLELDCYPQKGPGKDTSSMWGICKWEEAILPPAFRQLGWIKKKFFF